MSLCQYKTSLGKPGVGAHKHFMGVAVTDLLVKWGYLLIGLSLFLGLLTRVGATIGAALMFIYYLAHLDFPYVENKSCHSVFAGESRTTGDRAGIDRRTGQSRSHVSRKGAETISPRGW